MKLNKKDIICLIIIFLVMCFFSVSVYDKIFFSNPDFSQTLFTVINPSGTTFEIVLKEALCCIPVVLIGTILLGSPIIICKKMDKFNLYTKTYTSVISLIMIAISLSIMNFPSYFIEQTKQSSFIEDNYVDPKSVSITFPDKKKNLIYIFVESLESSYTNVLIEDEKVNLIPNLERIADENINFSSTDSLGGSLTYPLTNWTAAATISHMSGLPLKVKPSLKYYGTKGSFMPKATLIGDILKKEGYSNYFLLGSKSEFGGAKALLESHGGYEIRDYVYALNNNLIPEDYYVFWGYEDEKLFNIAKEDILEISKKGEPFNYTIQTIDTHPKDGYLDSACEEKYNYQYGNVIACEDERISNFIDWLKDQDFYENTTIIITGDHVSMQWDVKDHLIDDNRTIYNAFINSGYSEYNESRNITPFDMFPTTLASLGATIEGNRLGIGVNLFSSEKTLVEKYGYEEVTNELKKNSDFYYSEFYD